MALISDIASTATTPVGTELLELLTAGGQSQKITAANLMKVPSPQLDDPALGDATATTINKVTITQPASGAVLTLANGKTVNVQNTVTLSATDGAAVALGAGGTVVYETTTQTLTGKTLTAPKISSGSHVADANGNEVLKVTATANAVNELTVANAAVGGSPTLSATGDDTNIDLRLKPKGSGSTTLLDGNSNEVLKTATTASAVNELTATNAATGNAPALSATGDDTNIDLALTPKGTGKVTTAAGVRSTHATSGIGYGVGAGGTVAQATSKSTGVTLDKASGEITMNGAALASGTTVSFTLTNSAIEAADVMVLNHSSAGTVGAYTLNAQCAAGSATISVRNITGGSLSEAIVLRFALIKGAVA